MGTVLFIVMPDTLHLLCKWHVLRKAPESFRPVYSKNSEFRYQFHKLVNAMLTRDEFESAWEAMVVKYDLRDHPFMTRIYDAERNGQSHFRTTSSVLG
jgi:sirohydrochlorin ferrochelatase